VGTDAHVEVAQSIQAKIGASEANLLCGVHDPTDPATAQRLLARGLAATPNRHNCSGKHSGMLALARHHDWPLDDYVNPRHPAQQAILAAFAEMCGLPEAEVVVGTDGCSAPNFAVPLVNAATAFARLANPGAAPGARGLPHRRANAVRTLFYAMTAHPEMVRGLGGFDTELMRRRPGLLVSKAGAEGYQGIGLAAGALRPGSPALGVALKVADGTGRAVAPAALAVLKQLGLLDEHDLELLAAHGHAPRQPLRNWRGLVVGEARAVLSLDFSGLG
jgi:L-asparaginase II